MSRALGSFDQNWTLDCVCDECNQYFADTLELPLGRDSIEALLRLELGLKPPSGSADLLNRRLKTRLRDPGQFDGIRLILQPSADGSEMEPVPVPQVGFRREGNEWCFLTERELTSEHVAAFTDSPNVEIRIYGIGEDTDRLRQRLQELGIGFEERRRALKQPLTDQPSLKVVHDVALQAQWQGSLH